MHSLNAIEKDKVGNLTSGWKFKAWVINLARDTSRREEMSQQMKNLGIDFEFFSAVDGKLCNLDDQDLIDKKGYEKNMGSALLPGKVGCYQSHLRVWGLLVASNNDFGLIMEDDVFFHEDFLDALSAAVENFHHWDLLRFNCVRAKIPITQKNLGKYKINAYIGPFTGNGCYVIKRETAARILPRLLPQRRALDHELNRFFEYNFRQFGLEPFSSYVDDKGVSSITGTNYSHVRKFGLWNRRYYYFTKAVNYFRRFSWLLKNGYIMIP